MSDRPTKGGAEQWRRATVWAITIFAATLPFSHVPAQLAVAGAFIAWIGWSITSRKPMVEKDVFFLAAGVYWLWNIVAAVLSVRPWHTLGAFVDNEWPALSGIMLFWAVRDTSELRRILVALFGAAGVAMVYGIVQTLTGVEWIKGVSLHIAAPGLYRSVGFSGFYLTFAGFAMAIFFLSIAYASEQPGRKERWILPLLSILAILGTFARSVWLAMALLVPIFALIAANAVWKKRLLAGGVVLLLVLLSIQPFRNRALSIFDFKQHETRLNLWKTSIKIAEAHPIVGIGQDNFTLAFQEYRVEGYYDTYVHPHNDYLSVLVHGGVPALAAFVVMWVIVLRRGWKAWRSGVSRSLESWMGLGGMIALAAFLGSSMFQNYYGTFVNCFNWWLITGLILSCYKLRHQIV